jgi:hypothetical protein
MMQGQKLAPSGHSQDAIRPTHCLGYFLDPIAKRARVVMPSGTRPVIFMAGTAECHRHLLAPRETVQLEFMVGDLHARVLSAWLRVQTPKGTQGQDTYIVLWLSTPITCRVQLWCGCRLAHACRRLNTSSLWIIAPTQA